MEHDDLNFQLYKHSDFCIYNISANGDSVSNKLVKLDGNPNVHSASKPLRTHLYTFS